MKFMENEYLIGERLYCLSLFSCRNKGQLKQGKKYTIKLRVNELEVTDTGIEKVNIFRTNWYFTTIETAVRRFFRWTGGQLKS